MFITAKEFANITGENYNLILSLCKEGKLKCIETEGGHYKIFKTELDKYMGKNTEFISKEQYEEVIRENERLKTFILQLKSTIEAIN